MAPQTLTIILTGGTIDFEFDPMIDGMKPARKSVVQKYLNSLNLQVDCNFKSVPPLKDSRQMTENDRIKILNAIEQSPSNRFLIVHGTYRMVETAQFLQKNESHLQGKTIVLMGASTPLRHFYQSDATFNLGFAMATLLHSLSGIYIAMNGAVFTPDKVLFNPSKVRFEDGWDVPEWLKEHKKRTNGKMSHMVIE
ncbi:MAG: asparaginase domain-containing protein [Patescibacteria group bacterium]